MFYAITTAIETVMKKSGKQDIKNNYFLQKSW